MTMLVTLAQAKDHLHIEHSDEDAKVTLNVHAASGAVLNYLKGANRYVQADVDGTPAFNVEGDPIYTTDILFEVQAATLLMLGYLHVNRDNDKDHEYEPGFLPRPVTALLYPLRVPALA